MQLIREINCHRLIIEEAKYGNALSPYLSTIGIVQGRGNKVIVSSAVCLPFESQLVRLSARTSMSLIRFRKH